MSGPRGRDVPAGAQVPAGAALYEELTRPLLERSGVELSTMMGLPCLRLDGTFFASWEPRSRALVLKLPAERVRELVATGPGVPFAPNGRVFREWVAVPVPDREAWTDLLDEAYRLEAGRRAASSDAPPFTGFPEDGFAFLTELAADTTADFVRRHRERYRHGVLEPSKAFVTALAPVLASRVSPGLTGSPEVGGSLFRFAVDRRFARDRPAYRTEVDLLLWEGDEPPRANPSLLLRLTPTELHLGAGLGGLTGPRLAAYRGALREDAEGLGVIVDALLDQGASLSEPTRRRVPADVGPGEQAARFGVRDGFHVMQRFPRPEVTASPELVTWCAYRLERFGPLHRWWVAALRTAGAVR